MLNAVKYNHTVAFLRNWPALSVLNFKKMAKNGCFLAILNNFGWPIDCI